ncbi:MAG: Fic family protein [Phycisphaerae bacterium]|nr:Fic family protein [Phycisphaerae bacterium]
MASRRMTGRYVTISTAGETCRAFVPDPLPPADLPAMLVDMLDLLEKANRALGKLDGLSAILPDTDIFLYMYVRKEAVLSSQIEGTQSSLSDLLLFESAAAPGVPLRDVQEVSNYVAALQHGLRRMKGGFPLSLRLLREIHGVLLSKGRGSDKAPGEFRRSQNWIGGTRPGNARFVPPPPEHIMDCMGALEKFLHNQPVATPTLVKAALAHVQFETIHPFLDGNGRLGRLLITLILCAEKALDEPLLYLSLYFKQNRPLYYDLLQRVRNEGGWREWIGFFLEGVAETGEQAGQTARKLLSLFGADRERIQTLGRPAASALRVHQHLERRPITTVQAAARALKITEPTARAAFRRLQKLGIAREITGRRRRQVFSYDRYVKILSEGTTPL